MAKLQKRYVKDLFLIEKDYKRNTKGVQKFFAKKIINYVQNIF